MTTQFTGVELMTAYLWNQKNETYLRGKLSSFCVLVSAGAEMLFEGLPQGFSIQEQRQVDGLRGQPSSLGAAARETRFLGPERPEPELHRVSRQCLILVFHACPSSSHPRPGAPPRRGRDTRSFSINIVIFQKHRACLAKRQALKAPRLLHRAGGYDLIRPSSVLFIGKCLQPGADIRAVFGVVAAELEEKDVALRHIRFDCFGIAGAEVPVALQKRLQLGLGPQEFLSRPPKHRPGDIEFLISISGKLKIQNAADMMPFPEDIRIVKTAVAKTHVGSFLCGWKTPLEVLQLQRFQYRIRRRVKEFSVLYALCLNIQLMDSG